MKNYLIKIKFTILILLFSLNGLAQLIPPFSDIPEYFTPQEKVVFNDKKSLLLDKKSMLKAKAATLKNECGNVPDSDIPLNNECKAKQRQIEKEKSELIVAINEFNNNIVTEFQNFFATKEQKELDKNFDVWISDQHNKVQEAVKADSNWTNQFKDYLKGFALPDLNFRPKGLNDLKNGDVLLLFPITAKDKLIDLGDKFYNKYNIKDDLQACHALVFVGRDPGGKALFLNNTAKSYLDAKDSPGGPHIISQSEFEKLYGNYDYYAARPKKVVDGKKLFLAAQEMQIDASKKISLLGSSYGVLGNDIVCSQSSDMVVAKATGRQKIDKGRFIDVTPNNFFDKQDVGRYYIISPLVKQK